MAAKFTTIKDDIFTQVFPNLRGQFKVVFSVSKRYFTQFYCSRHAVTEETGDRFRKMLSYVTYTNAAWMPTNFWETFFMYPLIFRYNYFMLFKVFRNFLNRRTGNADNFDIKWNFQFFLGLKMKMEICNKKETFR